MSKSFGANAAFPKPKEPTQKEIEKMSANPNNLKND